MNWISLVACGFSAFIFLGASYLAWESHDDADEDKPRSLAAVIAPAIPGVIFAAGFVNVAIAIIRQWN
jgi:hypothetical protein